MIKFWSKIHFHIFWHSFTRDNMFPQTPSLIFPRKILPPASLDTSTTALVCIFSSILNSIMEGWKYRSRKLLKAIFCYKKKEEEEEESRLFLKICMKLFSDICMKCLNPQVRINKMINEYTVHYQPSHISMDSYRHTTRKFSGQGRFHEIRALR